MDELAKRRLKKAGLVNRHGQDLPTKALGQAKGGKWTVQQWKDMVKGDVVGIPRKLVPKFREPIEAKAGEELPNLRCSHTENGVYIRYVILSNGIACLDCMVRAVNDVYPR